MGPPPSQKKDHRHKDPQFLQQRAQHLRIRFVPPMPTFVLTSNPASGINYVLKPLESPIE